MSLERRRDSVGAVSPPVSGTGGLPRPVVEGQGATPAAPSETRRQGQNRTGWTMIGVFDPAAARQALARRLRCPDCGAPLAPWGRARLRTVRDRGGQERTRPDRARGLRSDEICRLCLGCSRWQHNGSLAPGDARDVLAPGRRLTARRAGPQDRDRVHRTGRPDHRPGHRGLICPAAGPAPAPGPQDQRVRRPAVQYRRSPGRQVLHQHQPHDHPGALPQGRCPHRGHPRQHHQPPRPSTIASQGAGRQTRGSATRRGRRVLLPARS